MSKQILSDLDFNSAARILNLPDPTLAQHPATKAYVDSAVEGLAWKDSVRVATVASITLSGWSHADRYRLRHPVAVAG